MCFGKVPFFGWVNVAPTGPRNHGLDKAQPYIFTVRSKGSCPRQRNETNSTWLVQLVQSPFWWPLKGRFERVSASLLKKPTRHVYFVALDLENED